VAEIAHNFTSIKNYWSAGNSVSGTHEGHTRTCMEDRIKRRKRNNYHGFEDY